jgi:hypothetical protein
MNPGLRGRQVPEPSGLDVDKENEAGSSEVLQRAMQEKTSAKSTKASIDSDRAELALSAVK